MTLTSTVLLDTPGYDRALELLAQLRNPDFAPLFPLWERLIIEDNRTGVMAGLDKEGLPLEPVTYRTGKAMPVTARTGKTFGTNASKLKGFRKGGMTMRFKTILPNNNLTTAEYRKLTGPPLAPRGEQSRVITNLRAMTPRREGDNWVVSAAWVDVVSADGTPFLTAHFEGAKTGKGLRTRLPRRDLRGVRPEGRQAAVELLIGYAESLMRA